MKIKTLLWDPTKLIGFIGVLALASAFFVQHMTKPAYADFSSPAFPCDGSFYQARTAASVAHLYKLVLDQSGSYTEVEVGPLSPGYSGLNGIGYNPTDGYIYGFIHSVAGGINQHLYRINDSGVVTDLGLVSGISGAAAGPSIAGATFTESGIMYAIQQNISTASYDRFLTINPSTMAGTVTTLSTPINQGDIAIDPTTNTLYGVDAGGGIVTINPTTGVVTPVGGPSLPNGSAFFDAAGNLYAAGNAQGRIYYVNKNTGQYTLIATGPSASSSDGASCAYGQYAVDAIKSQTSVTQLSLTSFRVQYSVGVKNLSTSISQNVQLTEKLNESFKSGSPTIAIQSAPSVTAGTCTVNGTFNGTTDTKLLAGTDDFSAGQECRLTFTIDVTYPSTSVVPSATQNNSIYASSSTLTTNPGYTFINDGNGNMVPIPPPSLLAGDTSTNTSTFPATENGDTASPTPTNLPVAAIVNGYKSVKYTDINGNGLINPGDQLTYTVTYRNDGNAAESGFQITDTIPTGTTYQAGSLTITPSGSGQTGTVNSTFNGTSTTAFLSSPVTLQVNGVITATFTVTINSGVITTLSNQASGDGNTINPVLSDAIDNSASGTCQAPSGISVPAGSVNQTCTVSIDPTLVASVQNRPRLVVTKTDSATSIQAGQQLTYTITVRNPSVDSTAQNLVLTDALPANTTFVSASGGGTESGGVVTWNIASLAGTTSTTRTVTVTVGSSTPNGTVLTNSASGTSSTDSAICSRAGSSCTGTDTDTVVSNPPIVTLSKSDGTTSIQAGQQLTYTLTITNPQTGSTATNLVVTDTLPAGLTFVSASNGGTLSGNVVTWNIASLAGGSSTTRTVTVTVPPSTVDNTTLTNTASVSSTTDSGLCSRSGSVCSAIDSDTQVLNPPVVTLSKTDGRTAIAPGQPLTYTLTINNTAVGSTAANLVVTDTLPGNVTFVSASNGGTLSGNVVTWNIASLAGGSSTTVTVTLTVNSGTPDGTTLTNNASLSSATDSGLCTRPNSDCSATDTTSVTNQAIVELTKTDNTASATRGQSLTYSLAVTNPIVGSTAANLVVTDTLPANVTFVSASNGGTLSGNVVTWNIASLAGGDSTTVTVTVTVNGSVNDGDTITNNATIESTSDTSLCSRNGSVCAASDSTTADIAASITVDKSDNRALTAPGDTLTYTITITNTAAGSTATNIAVTDTLPQHLTIAAISDAGTANGSVVTWNIASLPGGSSVTRTVTATVDTTAPDGFTLTNTADATVTGEPTACTLPTARCSATDTTTVDIPANPFDPPSGYKTFDAAGLPRLHWQMVWINDANSGPEHVRIVDPLQADTSYIANSLHCEARGSSSTTRCEYDAATKSVIWEGVMGSDAGATDEASAANEVVITLDVDVPQDVNEVSNQGKAYWDQNGDGVLDASDQNVANDRPVLTGDGRNTRDGAGNPTVFTRAASLADTGAAQSIAVAVAATLLVAGLAIARYNYRLARS